MAGEYVSVSSQADTESADLDRKRNELAVDSGSERAELAAIYVTRGLAVELPEQVATQLMATDALGAHARDELGISDALSARPVPAAFASAGSVTVGALLPLLLVLIVPQSALVWMVSGGSLVRISVFRVTFWGALAMALIAGVGALFGAKL